MGTSRALEANWTSETVVSPATRSDDVSSTRAAIFSSAVANRLRVAASPRIEAEKSKTWTTSDWSGPCAATGATPSAPTTTIAAARAAIAGPDTREPRRLFTTLFGSSARSAST